MNFLSLLPNNLTFKMYGLYHLPWFLFLILACALIFFRKNTIRRNYTGRWYFLLFGIPAFTLEVIYLVWNFAYNGGENIFYSIPWDASFIGIILSVILFASRKKEMFPLVYFCSFLCLINLFVPSFGEFGPDTFRYYQYFYCNFFVVFANVYFIYIKNYNLKGASCIIEYNVFMIVIIAINILLYYLCEVNYFISMVSFIPQLVFKITGSSLFMIISFFALNFIISIIGYIPWVMYNRKNKNEIVADVDKDFS